MKNFSMTLKRHSTASPEAIYDVLADLRTHLVWGGAQQRFGFRLLSLDAPAGPATTGTSFTSTGGIPMSPRHFEDRSAVTLAVRPSRFEFVTYERKPYPLLSASSFTEKVTFRGKEFGVHETRTNLGNGRGRLRRIALLAPDGHQVNLLAASRRADAAAAIQ
jgi:hypothetical protein